MYGFLPHLYWQRFLLWLLAVTSSETKMFPLKMGLLSLGVYYVWFYPPPTGRAFCILQVSVSRCIACYPSTIGKDFFSLDCCSVASNEAKMLPLKMGLPSLEVAFSQARYFGVRDSYHQEYS